LAGKYLTFLLGEEEYGLEILKVQEIIQMQKVTKVPKAPDFVRGVINLRGKVIPVIELRKKFGMERRDDTEKTCIIVVMIEAGDRSITMGIIIDEVKEVLDIEAGNIEETPSFGASIDTDFIMGIGKMGENVKMLLDIDRVLSLGELEVLGRATGSR
jgi:purine-binding chemotaxis protein CheW